MTYTLREHQKTMLGIITERDRFLVLAEAGTGKTLPLVIHISNLLMSGEITDALVVAPLSGLGAWTRDTAKLTPARQRLLKDAITYVNYDKISRKGSKWQKMLWKSWGCIVLDEGHAIAKPTSNRTEFFIGKGKALGLVSKCDYFYDLTGTLINNSRLEDVWSPLRAVLGETWEYFKWIDFKRHFLVTITLPGSYAEIVKGYRNRGELLDLLAQHSYTVLKKDCLDLPAALPDEVVLVPWATGRNAEPFDKSSLDLYDDALDSFVEALDKVMDNPLTRRLALRQIAAGHIKESDTVTEAGHTVRGATHRIKNNKVAYAMELVKNNLPKKTVLFYQFNATCDALEKALKKAGVRYITQNGAQKDKNAWTRFQSESGIKVMVVQYQSGSSAIDLFASSYTVYMEPTDSSLIDIQSRARTDRSGQTEACSYTFLLTEGSVEVDMYNRLQKHQDFGEEAWREVAEKVRQRRGTR